MVGPRRGSCSDVECPGSVPCPAELTEDKLTEDIRPVGGETEGVWLGDQFVPIRVRGV